MVLVGYIHFIKKGKYMKFKAKFIGKGVIVSYFDLPSCKQIDILDILDDLEEAEATSYVLIDKGMIDEDCEVFDLGAFERSDDGIFDGISGCTNTSAYGIKIDKECESASVWIIY
jgi:hypothetical protein